MPKALITGGAGFIGSHLARHLLAGNWNVRIIDDLSMGSRDRLPDGAEFIKADIRDDSALGLAASGCDIIYHLAARVTIRGSVENFQDDAEVNLMGSLAVIRAAVEAGCAKMVLASSMAVYADAPGPEPIGEDHPVVPVSPYGVAKLAAERYLSLMGRELGLRTTTLRLFNTYGPHQTYTPYVGVITIFIRRILAGEPVVIFGDGNQMRDFVHVDDVARAFVSAAGQGADGQIMNIGTARATSVNRLWELISRNMKAQAVPGHHPARPEELRNSVADISLARKLMGYEPIKNLENDLAPVIDLISRQG